MAEFRGDRIKLIAEMHKSVNKGGVICSVCAPEFCRQPGKNQVKVNPPGLTRKYIGIISRYYLSGGFAPQVMEVESNQEKVTPANWIPGEIL